MAKGSLGVLGAAVKNAAPVVVESIERRLVKMTTECSATWSLSLSSVPVYVYRALLTMALKFWLGMVAGQVLLAPL